MTSSGRSADGLAAIPLRRGLRPGPSRRPTRGPGRLGDGLLRTWRTIATSCTPAPWPGRRPGRGGHRQDRPTWRAIATELHQRPAARAAARPGRTSTAPADLAGIPTELHPRAAAGATARSWRTPTAPADLAGIPRELHTRPAARATARPWRTSTRPADLAPITAELHDRPAAVATAGPSGTSPGAAGLAGIGTVLHDRPAAGPRPGRGVDHREGARRSGRPAMTSSRAITPASWPAPGRRRTLRTGGPLAWRRSHLPRPRPAHPKGPNPAPEAARRRFVGNRPARLLQEARSPGRPTREPAADGPTGHSSPPWWCSTRSPGRRGSARVIPEGPVGRSPPRNRLEVRACGWADEVFFLWAMVRLGPVPIDESVRRLSYESANLYTGGFHRAQTHHYKE